MKIDSHIKIFDRLPLHTKLLVYFSGFIFFVLLSFFFGSIYFDKYVLLWVGITIIILSLSLVYIVSISVSKHVDKMTSIISDYSSGNLDIKSETQLDEEFKELLKSLNILSDSFKSDIDEKISNENLAMMGEFATFIIHDLKNPISGIHLLAEGLNKKITANDDLKKYANEILFASQKLDDFIKRTLDITKSMVMYNQELNINQLIDDATAEINFSGVEIEVKLDKSIPAIIGDYQLLSRAITNIVNNAIESIEVEGKIIVETKRENKLIISISDNGTGIDENQIKTIFRPFYSSKGQGHGLGLAMAKKAVLMHQGTIGVESKTGKGSIFTISLPFIKENQNTASKQIEKE
jgi:signal transduction histidine kinase